MPEIFAQKGRTARSNSRQLPQHQAGWLRIAASHLARGSTALPPRGSSGTFENLDLRMSISGLERSATRKAAGWLNGHRAAFVRDSQNRFRTFARSRRKTPIPSAKMLGILGTSRSRCQNDRIARGQSRRMSIPALPEIYLCFSGLENDTEVLGRGLWPYSEMTAE